MNAIDEQIPKCQWLKNNILNRLKVKYKFDLIGKLLTSGYNSIKTLINAHCTRYGTNNSWYANFFFTEGGLIIFVVTNISICLLNSELTKSTKEFVSSGSLSYSINKIQSYYNRKSYVCT